MKIYCDDKRHLVCIPYSVQNLHRMAEDLGIRKCWFHKNHYDIPKGMINFVTNIAESLQNVVSNANQLEQQRQNATNQQIGLVFEKWEYKYKISKPVWEVGKNLADFINYLATK